MSKGVSIIFIIGAAVVIMVYLYFAARPGKDEIKKPEVVIVSENILEGDAPDLALEREDFASGKIPLSVKSSERGRKNPFLEP